MQPSVVGCGVKGPVAMSEIHVPERGKLDILRLPPGRDDGFTDCIAASSVAQLVSPSI